MSSTIHGYPTVSHLVLLAPAEAAAAFDVMILDPAVATDLIPAGSLRRAQPSGYAALRALPATLRLSGRRRAIEVILELLPWSDHRSELAIWTSRRPHLFVARDINNYENAAARTLATLAGLIEARCSDRPSDSVAHKVVHQSRHHRRNQIGVP